MKKSATSYVEVVLTLTILGIISALVVPGLAKHSQRTEFAALAKKAYMNLEDVADNAILQEGPIRNWDFSSNAAFYSKYLRPNIEARKYDDANFIVYGLDGIRYQVAECSGSFCHVHVDVNSEESPNLAGKDNFEFQFNKNSEDVIPASYGGADLLRRNNWKFTDRLWECTWTSGNGNGCGL